MTRKALFRSPGETRARPGLLIGQLHPARALGVAGLLTGRKLPSGNEKGTSLPWGLNFDSSEIGNVKSNTIQLPIGVE